MMKRAGYLFLCFLLLVILLIPKKGATEEEYYTIQAATYLSIIEAEKNYDILYRSLAEQDRDYLRVELIKGRYYTLRVGRFNSFREAVPVLKKVKEVFPTAYIMKAYIKDERIKRMYVRESGVVKAPVETPERPARKEAPKPLEKEEIARKEAKEQPKKEKTFTEPARTIPEARKGHGPLPFMLIGVAIVVLILFIRLSPRLLRVKIPVPMGNQKRVFNMELNLRDLKEDDIRGFVEELKKRLEFVINDVGLQNLPENIEYIESGEDSIVVYRKLKDSLDTKKNIVVLSSTSIPAGSVIRGGVFVKGDVRLDDHVSVNSLFSEGEISTGRGVKFVKVVFSEGAISLGDDSLAGELTFSDAEIVLNRGVTFRNLYGRPVRTYDYEDMPAYSYADLYSPHLDELPFPIKSLKDTIWFTKEDFVVPEKVRIHKNLVTNANLTISRGSIIHGYIKAHRDVYLGSNVSVNGDVIAYNDLFIGENVRIYGDIYAKGKIHIDRGARIGGRARVVSITSNNEIKMGGNVEIYGMIKARRGTVI
ncbi:MAG TPA: hypothetical protein ENK09_02155 [Nitrospirae bacterium]|nr:hypothetical protein [Nitrospirota bacterium]